MEEKKQYISVNGRNFKGNRPYVQKGRNGQGKQEQNKKQQDQTVQKKRCNQIVRRGDLFWADLSESTVGSEQRGIRPVIVISNNIGNKHSGTVIVVCLSSKIKKASLPTHVEFPASEGVKQDSIVFCEQIRTIDKSRLMDKITSVSDEKMAEIDIAIKVSLGLIDF